MAHGIHLDDREVARLGASAGGLVLEPPPRTLLLSPYAYSTYRGS